MEPYAPRPDLRLAAVAKFAEAGIRVGVIASPVLPMITDSASSLDAIGAAAKRAGAVTFSANVLFLKPCSQRVFFPFLEQQFPHLFARYKANYEHEAFINGPYPDRIRQLVKQIRERYGLFARDAGEAPAPSESEQLTLFS
jgi:DNA repair photolyase